jgi:peptidoglycan/LPS O-acetylase OafA/YrhL
MDVAGFSLFGLFFACALICVLTASRDHILVRLLSSGPLAFLGTYSYALYVIHQPLLALTSHTRIGMDRLLLVLRDPWLAAAVGYAVYFALAISLALASWHLLEKHFLRLKDHPALRY